MHFDYYVDFYVIIDTCEKMWSILRYHHFDPYIWNGTAVQYFLLETIKWAHLKINITV